MKQFFLFSLILIIFYLAGLIIRKQQTDINFFNRDYTTAIKGVSILSVVWAHSGAKLGVEGIQFVAGIGVALFLVCSGYGLEMSYQKNGIRRFWLHRFLRVYIPYNVVALLGMLINGTFTFKALLSNALLINPIAGGWYIQYIIICYFLFYISKVISIKVKALQRYSNWLLFFAFALWFLIDSMFFANPDMPFLWSRQMLSFPCGILIARYRSQIEEKMTKKSILLAILGFGALGLCMMAVTQIQQIKDMNYVVSNLMSLATVLPLAFAVILIEAAVPKIFTSSLLMFTGVYSYEIFLVQSFSIPLINNSITSIFVFFAVTTGFSILLHKVSAVLLHREDHR